jgi:small-conductance mechanosensitive channel
MRNQERIEDPMQTGESMSTSTVESRPAGAIRPMNRPIRPVLKWAGFAAGAILIAFGIAAIVMGFNGRSTVNDSLEQENIVGSPDMTPSAIAKEAKEAGLKNVDLPTASVANEPIDNGSEARTFSEYMRVHALEATGGYTYAQMGQFEAKPGTPKSQLEPGGGTSNEKFAAIDPQTKGPAANSAREVWVTETALSTALNSSYMADRISVFGIVVGIALVLSGIGFIVLAFVALRRRAATG